MGNETKKLKEVELVQQLGNGIYLVKCHIRCDIEEIVRDENGQLYEITGFDNKSKPAIGWYYSARRK